MTKKVPKYVNQPVRACSLETYFRGDLQLYSRFGLVQKRFKDEFPNLFVPRTQLDEPLALRPFQLRPLDASWSLALALNQASIVSYRYPGSEKFLAKAVGELSEVLQLLEIEDLTRVVYRYDNDVALVRDARGLLNVGSILKINVPLGASEPNNFHDINLELSQPIANGRVSTEIAIELRDNVDVLRFSLRAQLDGGSRGTLNELASQAHQYANDAFYALITDEYRTQLKEEPDEPST